MAAMLDMTSLLIAAQVTEERVLEVCGEDPRWSCRQVLELTGSDTVARLVELTRPLAILLILVGAWIVSRLSRRGVKHALRRLHSGGVRERLVEQVRAKTPHALLETRETPTVRSQQRMEALSTVLQSVASFTIWVIAIFMVLGQLGLNLAPLLAGAGVIGIALGFGSQTLVKDFLSGMFILIEDQFGVGDIVDVGDTPGEISGVVEAVSLRTTRVRSVDGVVWHVPNGEIRQIGNKSQHWSRALLDIEVSYNTDLELAQRVIKDVADRIAGEEPAVLEEPEIWGVEALGASGIAIRLVVKTRPSEQYRISRSLRLHIKEAFDAAGIEIPFPQQTVWIRGAGTDGDATPRTQGRSGEHISTVEPGSQG
jgi:moderate conductance mechanosensitive channel